MYWYKIVDIDSEGNFKMLFHGINGSKILPIEEWIEAESKTVTDGTNGTKYDSGWHIMATYDEAEEYLSKFTDKTKNRGIVIIDVRGRVWPKKHSNSNVFLCEWIKVFEEVGGF